MAETAAVARYRKKHPFASASEINAERTRIRATSPGISRPYYDVTSSASKSVGERGWDADRPRPGADGRCGGLRRRSPPTRMRPRSSGRPGTGTARDRHREGTALSSLELDQTEKNGEIDD